MNAMHQHMIDNYRAAVHGDQAPPQPGRHDWQVIREVADYRRFRRVVAARPAAGPLRRALATVRAALRGDRRPRTAGARPAGRGRPAGCG
ncbi:hypothetical protein ACF08N_18850 [Streptomyces sp. NPDC015127]|uniref:hypothetical protein n=1 Tax=Streptomyces sp. NPDC015127 TaxID=3364939 RepID=UPI003700E4D7